MTQGKLAGAANADDLCAMDSELTVDQKREWAEFLYTVEGLKMDDVALKVHSTEAMVTCWIREGNWDGRRRTMLTTRRMQMKQYFRLLEQITEKINADEDVNPKDVDLAVKYTAAIKNLNAEVTAGETIEVARAFVLWLQRRNLQMAKEVAEEFDVYIVTKVKEEED